MGIQYWSISGLCGLLVLGCVWSFCQVAGIFGGTNSFSCFDCAVSWIHAGGFWVVIFRVGRCHVGGCLVVPFPGVDLDVDGLVVCCFVVAGWCDGGHCVLACHVCLVGSFCVVNDRVLGCFVIRHSLSVMWLLIFLVLGSVVFFLLLVCLLLTGGMSEVVVSLLFVVVNDL